MELIVLGSSSKGNCYLLTNGEETLIIECGVQFNEVQSALDYKVSSIVGAIVSHEHKDHSKYTVSFASRGIPVLADEAVLAQNDATSNGIKIVPPISKTEMGRFTVLAFEVHHDVPTFGFHIAHPECGNILFLTDTYYCEYTFPNLNHILVEANYASDILYENIRNGIVHKYVEQRVHASHMEIETTKGVLRANDLSKVKNIVLIHLSNDNSDEKRFVLEAERTSGKPVYVAQKGVKLNMDI